MMKLFVAGSIRLDFLSSEVVSLIEKHKSDGTTFLVGDAPGIDRAFQQLLAKDQYPAVTVFTSSSSVRHNLGEWETYFVPSGLKSSGHASHAIKDRRMSSMADAGLMVWDATSTGTLANALDLVGDGKHCVISIEGRLKSLKTFAAEGDFAELESQVPAVFAEARKRLLQSRKRLRKILEQQNGILDLEW
jgi:hypothetical protein